MTQIPEFARVIAVADAFDSMTSTRSYRGARRREAVAELERCKGTQFDPVMVESLASGLDSDGWDVADTVPADLPAPTGKRPLLLRQRRRRSDGCDCPRAGRPARSRADAELARRPVRPPAADVSGHWLEEGRGSRPFSPFAAVVAVGVVAAVAVTATKGLEQAWLAGAFVAFIAVGELLRISLPGNRDAAPLGSAAAVAYALLPGFDGSRLDYSVPQVATVVTVGVLLGAVPRAVAGRPIQLDDLARRVVMAAILAGIFRLLLFAGAFDPHHPDWQAPPA